MKKTVKIALWSAGSLLVLTGGTLFILKRVEKKPKFKEEIPDETIINNVGVTIGQPVNLIGSQDDVKKFQDWMDVKHPNWLNNGKSLNKGAGYGNFGSQTSKAWGKYAEEYQKGVSPSATVKKYNAYSAVTANPIYSKVGDILPFRFAGNSELLGTLTGVIKKDFSGNPFAEIKQPDGKNRYAKYNSIKLKQ